MGDEAAAAPDLIWVSKYSPIRARALRMSCMTALEQCTAFAGEGFACGGADVRFSSPTLKQRLKGAPRDVIAAVKPVNRPGSP
jgi:hypothetical protein